MRSLFRDNTKQITALCRQNIDAWVSYVVVYIVITGVYFKKSHEYAIVLCVSGMLMLVRILLKAGQWGKSEDKAKSGLCSILPWGNNDSTDFLLFTYVRV